MAYTKYEAKIITRMANLKIPRTTAIALLKREYNIKGRGLVQSLLNLPTVLECTTEEAKKANLAGAEAIEYINKRITSFYNNELEGSVIIPPF